MFTYILCSRSIVCEMSHSNRLVQINLTYLILKSMRHCAFTILSTYILNSTYSNSDIVISLKSSYM